MDTLGPASPSCLYIAEHLGDARFTLVDVGCAGGVHPSWRGFGSRLRAIGFDGNAAEVARLNAAETGDVRYVASLVGLPPGDPGEARMAAGAFWDRNPSGTLSWARTYAAREGRAYVGLDRAAPETPFSPPAQFPAPSTASVDLNTYLPAHGYDDVDFLKLDVDGPDFLILRSMARRLTSPQLLGVGVEVNFFGSDDEETNTFHNMDRLLRRHGFEMFSLSVRRYASAALPFPYVLDDPMMTVMGRPYQGDATYIRDVAAPTRRTDYDALTSAKLAKAAALFILHGLHDQAAQVALVHRRALETLLDVDHLLELLTAEVQGAGGTADYAGYTAAFDRDAPEYYARGGYPFAWSRSDTVIG